MASSWLLRNVTNMERLAFTAARDQAIADSSSNSGNDPLAGLVRHVGESRDGSNRVLALYWDRADMSDDSSVSIEHVQRALASAAATFGEAPFTLLVMCEGKESVIRLSSLYACALARWLPEHVRDNCQHVLLVFPGARTRWKLGLCVLSGLLPHSLYLKVQCIERLEMLHDFVSKRTVVNATTEPIKEHDEFLEVHPLADYGIKSPTMQDMQRAGGEAAYGGMPRSLAG